MLYCKVARPCVHSPKRGGYREPITVAIAQQRGRPMTFEILTTLFEQATTPRQRKEAVRLAFRMGIPLNTIEEYLDWLDSICANRKEASDGQVAGEEGERMSGVNDEVVANDEAQCTKDDPSDCHVP